MLRKNVLIGAAACAALAFAGITRADVADATSVINASNNVLLMDDSGPTTMPSTMAAPAATAPAAAPTPLNGLLAKIPGYGDTGISASGYVEGSWTYSAHPPAGNILGDRVFDTKTESLQFDAVDLLVTRATDGTKAFDIGFTLEQLYGWDSAYIHSNGLGFVSNGKTPSAQGPTAGTTATIHPKAQYDLNQANFVLSFGKVGNGLSVEGGKFDTLLGYEVIDAPSNPFFSHSYIFAEEPFTHTGLLGIYNITDPSGPTPVVATLGFTRGWDQATEDTNGSLDITGQLKYTVTNKWAVVLSAISGDEAPTPPPGVAGQDGWRTVLDANGTYNVSDELTLGFNGMFGWAAQTSDGGVGGGTGIWYGAAVYAKYVLTDYVTLNARGEWFDDQDGAAPTQLSTGVTNIPNEFFEVTFGASVKPLSAIEELCKKTTDYDSYLSALVIRPEFRWDYSDHAAFNGGAQNDQWTFGCDAYFAF